MFVLSKFAKNYWCTNWRCFFYVLTISPKSAALNTITNEKVKCKLYCTSILKDMTVYWCAMQSVATVSLTVWDPVEKTRFKHVFFVIEEQICVEYYSYLSPIWTSVIPTIFICCVCNAINYVWMFYMDEKSAQRLLVCIVGKSASSDSVWYLLLSILLSLSEYGFVLK